ncbi:MAG: DUF554 domain-containing protein [Halanaerobiaceae bacterium]
MQGTIVNVGAIIVGCTAGLLFRDRLPEKYRTVIMQGICLGVILIGLQMAMSVEESVQVIIVIFSLVIGGIVGEFLSLEKRLNNFGEYIKSRFSGEDEHFVEGFVQASLIYCVGAMAIMGAIEDGLSGDASLLYTKSLLDGTSAIAFTATFGAGVMFSAIPVFIYQGTISLLAAEVSGYLGKVVIAEMTSTGGLLIFAIGLNMLKITEIKIGNLLPSIFVAICGALLFL